MAKASTRYVCSNCGHTYASYLGKCPNCGAWNTLEEEVVAPTGKAASAAPRHTSDGRQVRPQKLDDVEIQKETLANNKTLINLENIKNQYIKKYANEILELRKIMFILYG